MLYCDEYLMPATLDEAFAMMADHRGRYRIVAGATDTLPWAREGRAGDVHVPTIIDISRLEELAGHRIGGGRADLGANVTFGALLEDPVLRTTLPVMPYVSVWFADDQIRAQATLGGNIVNASPAADGTPALLALNAELILESKDGADRGRRSIALSEFIRGPGRTALNDGELVTRIVCDALPGYGAAFEKVGHRRSLVISTVCVAALVKPDAEGRRFEDLRVAVAGVGPIPARLEETETALIGQPIEGEAIRAASALSADRVKSRTRQDYRRDVLATFIERAVTDALADAHVAVFDPGSGSVEKVHA